MLGSGFGGLFLCSMFWPSFKLLPLLPPSKSQACNQSSNRQQFGCKKSPSPSQISVVTFHFLPQLNESTKSFLYTSSTKGAAWQRLTVQPTPGNFLIAKFSEFYGHFVLNIFYCDHLPFLAGIFAFQTPGLGSYSMRATA